MIAVLTRQGGVVVVVVWWLVAGSGCGCGHRGVSRKFRFLLQVSSKSEITWPYLSIFTRNSTFDFIALSSTTTASVRHHQRPWCPPTQRPPLPWAKPYGHHHRHHLRPPDPVCSLFCLFFFVLFFFAVLIIYSYTTCKETTTNIPPVTTTSTTTMMRGSTNIRNDGYQLHCFFSLFRCATNYYLQLHYVLGNDNAMPPPLPTWNDGCHMCQVRFFFCLFKFLCTNY